MTAAEALPSRLQSAAASSDGEPAPGAWRPDGPGGPWVLRSSSLSSAGRRTVAQPPKNEAAAIAWKAARKETLGGNLGTGNRVSSVVQYPISCRDPSNNFSNSRNHIGAEDRRLMRVRVKHGLHLLRGRDSFSEAVLKVEQKLMDIFTQSGSLREAFFASDSFAEKLLKQAINAVREDKANMDLFGSAATNPKVTANKAINDLYAHAVTVATPLGSRCGTGRAALSSSASAPALV